MTTPDLTNRTTDASARAGGDALAGHRLASVVTFDVASRYPRPVGRNARLGHHGTGPTSPAAVITTDQGARGWALTHGRPDAATIDALTGTPLADLFDPATGVKDPRAAALDLALHDLAGVILGQPVHALVGGDPAPGGSSLSLPCYSGAIYFDDLDPEDAPAGVDAVLANARQDHDAGYRQFKLKVGRGHRWLTEGGLERDQEVTRAIAAAFPGVDILVDANDGFTPDQAIRFLAELRDGGISPLWLEEPFIEDAAALRRLREWLDEAGSPTLVAEGETDPDVPAVMTLQRDGLVDVLLMDVVTWGPTAWRALLADPATGAPGISPHAWGHPVKTMYAAQLGYGLGNCPTVEGVPGTCDGVDLTAYPLRDGRIHLPAGPGFGIPVPDDLVARA